MGVIIFTALCSTFQVDLCEPILRSHESRAAALVSLKFTMATLVPEWSFTLSELTVTFKYLLVSEFNALEVTKEEENQIYSIIL